MPIKTTIDNARKVLVLEIPMDDPTPSKSGKMLLLGGTEGWAGTGVKLGNGAEVRINVMAGFKNPNPPASAAA